jgi:hypothetical protein
MSENRKKRSAWFFGRKKKKTTKKKPQTLKKFFPTIKNSQGFAMHLCRYEETIRDYIFLPKNYGQLSVHRQPHQFCNDCKLKPCISIEHWTRQPHSSLRNTDCTTRHERQEKRSKN